MRLESRTSTLQELYAEETAKIREHFEVSGDGKCSHQEPVFLDRFGRLFNSGKKLALSREPLAGFCIAAMEDTVGALCFRIRYRPAFSL